MEHLEFSSPPEEQIPPSGVIGTNVLIFRYGSEYREAGSPQISIPTMKILRSTEVIFSAPEVDITPQPENAKPTIRPFSHI